MSWSQLEVLEVKQLTTWNVRDPTYIPVHWVQSWPFDDITHTQTGESDWVTDEPSVTVAWRTLDLQKQPDFRSKGELALITKVSEIFQQTIVLDWLVKARLGSFLLTSMRPLRFLRFKDKRHGAPSDLLRTLVPSLWGQSSLVTLVIQECGVQLWKNTVLLQGSNNCKLSMCPL